MVNTSLIAIHQLSKWEKHTMKKAKWHMQRHNVIMYHAYYVQIHDLQKKQAWWDNN